MKIFLGGPIQYAFDENDRFYDDLKVDIIYYIKYLEERKNVVFSAHIDEKFKKEEGVTNIDLIYARDYNWMLECDVYIAVINSLNDTIMRSDGTFIEIGWAMALHKPIILIVEEKSAKHLSDLVKSMVKNELIRLLFRKDEVIEDVYNLINCLNAGKI